MELEDSGSDFEEEYKTNYVKKHGAIPGSKRYKKHSKMAISDIMAEEDSSAESEASINISETEGVSTHEKCAYLHKMAMKTSNRTKQKYLGSKRELLPKNKAFVPENILKSKGLPYPSESRNNVSCSSQVSRKSFVEKFKPLSQLGQEPLNLSESSSEDDSEAKSSIRRDNSSEWRLETNNKEGNLSQKNSVHQHSHSEANEEHSDSQMASQLESLAMSYNQFRSDKGSHRKDITSKKSYLKEKDADIKELLSLGEGIDIPSNVNSIDIDTHTAANEISEDITIEVPSINYGKNKSKVSDPDACARREFMKAQRTFRILLHKASFLCHVSHLRYINGYLGASGSVGEKYSQLLLAIGLSVVPEVHAVTPDKLTIIRLGKLLIYKIKNRSQKYSLIYILLSFLTLISLISRGISKLVS